MNFSTRVVSAMALTCVFACSDPECPAGTMTGPGLCKVPEAGKAAPRAGTGATGGFTWPKFDDAGGGRGGSGAGGSGGTAGDEADAGVDASMSTNKTCGNGLLDPGEACDFNCPTECDTGNRCLVGRLEGSADECTAVCRQDRVTVCKGGDGCCPEGCENATDSDCSASCGDGEVQPPETCDGDCPADCDDGEACTVDMQTGSSEQCSITCTHEPARASRTPDGCCPAGANVATDPDCPQRCGDGVVTGNETCDPMSSKRCAASCDDGNPCTMDLTEGSASECTIRCRHEPMGSGSSCGGDSRCDDSGECQAPTCGDGRVDPGERCDGNCPTACEPPLNECQTHDIVGAGCQRRCERGNRNAGAMCNETRGACTPDGTCSRQIWFQGCVSDAGCMGALECDLNRNICTRECSGAAGECGLGGACIGGLCNLRCTADSDCKTGQACGNYEGNRLCRPKVCSPDSQSETLSCPAGFECAENVNGIMRCVGIG